MGERKLSQMLVDMEEDVVYTVKASDMRRYAQICNKATYEVVRLVQENGNLIKKINYLEDKVRELEAQQPMQLDLFA